MFISALQWEALIQRLKARIVLEHENKEAIAQANVKCLPSLQLDALGSTVLAARQNDAVLQTEEQHYSQSIFKVSAIVSTYNSEKFIRGCLLDLVEQTLYKKGELEIVVIDSASEQNEKIIVQEFQAAYSNIFYIRTQERETLYAAWNRGIQAARGQYITNANTDDRHRQDALEILSRTLDEHPEVDLVYGDCYVSTVANETYEENSKQRIYRYPEYFAPEALIHFQFGPQPMWRKSVHDKIGFFDGSFQAAGDYDFNIRFALKGLQALHISDALGLYLLHHNAISTASSDVMQRENVRIAQIYQTVDNVEKLYQVAGISCGTSEERANVLLDMSDRLRKFYPPWNEGHADSNIPFAQKCFLKAAEIYPQRKHILLYTDDPSLAGVAQYNHAILSGLAALGYQITSVQSKSDNLLVTQQKELGIQHFWLDYDTCKNFGRTLSDSSDAEKIFNAAKPELIIFSNCCPISNFAAKRFAAQNEIPYIVIEHCSAPYLAERFAVFLEELEFHYEQAISVITPSFANLSLLHQFFRLPKDKGQVIYHGRSAQYFTPRNSSVRDRLRQEYGIPANAIICFTAARLDAVKGYQYQIEAIKQLLQSESWHTLYFVWVGNGDLEAQLKQAIEQLRVSSQVKLLGECTNIVEWLDASDIFVLPSEFESFGLAIIEAMAKGLPVISSAVGGIPEALGDTGKLVPDPKIELQATVEELAITIQAWSVDPELRNSIGQAGKKRAKGMFREERMLEKTVEVIENALLPNGNHVAPEFPIDRQQIAKQWLSLPVEQLKSAYIGNLGKAHKMLLNSEIQCETLTDAEQKFVNEISAYISRGFEAEKSIQHLLAGMLYYRADQLPLQHDFSHIPHWLLKDYLQFLFSSPVHFQELGEAGNYYNHMQGWLDYLHFSIFGNPDFTLGHEVVNNFAQIANFIPVYFNELNLKDLYVKRAEILESFLKNQGFEVDYEFAARSINRKKIRLGVLASHFTPSAETFASLPVYEYISRDFEVILYSLNETGHPLEQYCRSCGNIFKLLPQRLSEQVNTIRADDIDILFIATNVTAVTNEICLLAMHRLARIQVTSGGSVVTTGMRHMDYYMSGTLTDPSPTAQEQYREKLVKLEGTAHCFSYATELEKVTVKVNRESLGISEDTVVFISGANFFKIIPELINTWAKIIAEVPNSVLLLLPFGPNWSNAYPKQAFISHLNSVWSRHRLETERLMVLDPQPVPDRKNVKEYFKIADVCLDSYPFAGTTSLVEPLQVNLPVIVRKGNNFRSAMGAAIVESLNIPDLVADSEGCYIQLAIALGTNPELRQQKSAQIKERMQANPRFLDSRSYSAQMGEIFQKLFYKYQAETLTENFKLRETNLIIFPDWNQPEEVLYQDLASVITSLVNHPNKTQITLLIHQGDLAEEEANLLLADITMNLLLEEDFDVVDDPEIALVGQLSEIQWEALLPRIQARIVLENENQEAIAKLPVEKLPHCNIESF
jgi:predicted O-linked N-acetylglucosamine transferase (SPINDLY family)/glycosyltransferase involved in cell wall biosynthesis/GT2 family glycosyltransferase